MKYVKKNMQMKKGACIMKDVKKPVDEKGGL